jgi:transposase-like protein
VSPPTVSELNKKIYATIEAWRHRPIEGEHPYVYLDGIVLKRSWRARSATTRRRTRVVEAFPDGQSALNLAAARLRHVAGTARSSKRYLNCQSAPKFDGPLSDVRERGLLDDHRCGF